MEKMNTIKVYTSSSGAELNISAPSTKQVISATNNRAQYYAEQAKKYRDEAKLHRDNAKYYAEQNSDVTFEYMDNVRTILEEKISNKQDSGDYALKNEIPIKVSELENDAEYVAQTLFYTVTNALKLPEQNGCEGFVLMSDGENESWVDLKALDRSQLTNCLLDVPQRIKYTLEGGTFTLKAGSVVIVPYGVEDLTAQYPVGSTFINENFKVADTQWYGGKFFVWAEVVEDMVNSAATTDTNTRTLYLTLNDNLIRAQFYSGSGAEEYTGTKSYLWYRTDENLTKRYSSGTLSTSVCSLPIGTCTANGTVYIGSIDQFFNGIGYIGSAVWADKGVKCSIPNGRNDDGTLKNLEITQPKLTFMAEDRSQTTTDLNKLMLHYRPNNGCLYPYLLLNNNAYYEQDNKPETSTQYYLWFDTDNNRMKQVNDYGATEVPCDRLIIGEMKLTSGSVSNFKTKEPFRALDYNDYISGVGSTAAYIVETYVNGTSGYRIWSDGYCEQWGSIKLTQANNANATVTLLKEYKDTNGTCLVTAGQITYGGGGINYGTVGGRFTANNQIYIMCGAGGEQPTQWRTTGYLA